MSETRRRTTKKVVRKRAVSKSNIILVVGSILIITPFLILGWILLSASLDTGTPILGDRYTGDLDPAITKSDIGKVENAVKALGGVDTANVELATATLRVYVDVDDSFSEEQASAKADEAYSAVMNVLDTNTYFTQTESKKMYDLEVHVYNLSKDRDSDAFSYVILTKTSSMSESRKQVVSSPLDADLAQQLRDDVEARNNPQPTPTESNEEQLVGEEEEQVSEENKTE